MKTILSLLLLIFALSVFADTGKPTTLLPSGADTAANADMASEPATASADSAPQDQPPSSNLGIQDEQPQVVYPSPEQVNQDTVNDVERSQLTPEQINRIKELNLERQRAASMPYVNPPVPVTRSLFVNLNAGVSPPVIRLARGQISSLVFSDMQGQPWNIDRASVNCILFSVPQCQGGGGKGSDNQEVTKTNVLTIEPNTPTAYGNIAVVLKGLPTPVIFILASGQKEVDMRLDAKIAGNNPDSQAQVTVTAMPQIDDSLAQFLDGVPPSSATKLHVTGADQIQAWKYNEHLYVRANADALYPAYTNSAKSTTGMTIYRFDEIYSSVTFTSGGQAITAFIED